MKVSQLPYERVSLEQVQPAMEALTARIRGAESAEEILAAREEFLDILREYRTAGNLAYLRWSLDMSDPFYAAEMEYCDETGPVFSRLTVDYCAALLDSPFRPELEQALSLLLFRSMEIDRRAMSAAIVEDMAEENRLVNEYSRLMSGMEFEFRGEKLPRPLLMKYAKDPDRATRRECFSVLGRGLGAHREELDGIYDRLVHVRDRMAKKMGCRNYVELGYYRMGRLCYDQETVKTFRENVLRDIVPVVTRLRTENAKRLGITDQSLYDEGVILPGGDPKPAGREAIFAAAREMYHAMGPETAAFIDRMLESEAFDVEPRRNKWGGGYCLDLPKYRQPFILANFNGTCGDVDVVTHEAGHALNAWLTADNRFALELQSGGMETAETHSMSMEFFAWPYMEKFFGAEAERYKFRHALSALAFIPYGVIVDAFQHIVYEEPDMTPAERNAAWLRLESAYRPHMTAEGIPYLEEGTRWQYQMHIYEMPFYYIDYCLAQTAAFRFLLASREDYADAFARYLRFSRRGGEMVWTDLLAEAGFPSPFEPGALRELAEKVEKLLSGLSAD